MAFTKKTWVNVPDPSNPPSVPEGQDALARFDADNMNRIEEGISDSHALIKNHGLGTTTPTYYTDIVKLMSQGSGFYCAGTSSDSPKGTNEWLNILQTVRSQTEGKETGAQMVFYDQNVNLTKMWLRTIAEGTVGNWVEMIHTGNLNLLPFARVKTGMYVGDGNAGVDYPNTLTFDFEPKIVIVGSINSADGTGVYPGSIRGGFPWIRGMASGATYGHKYSDAFGILGVKLTWGDKTLSWYHGSDSTYQLNQSSSVYYYVAIG